MLNSMIYCNSPLTVNRFKDYKHTDDLFYYIQDRQYKKYAFLFCWDSHPLIKYGDLVGDICSVSEHVYLYASEFYTINATYLKAFDRPNVTIFCPKVNLDFYFAKVYPCHFWFGYTADLYKNYIPDWLDGLVTDQPKEKYFDVLLGHQRDNRDIFYHELRSVDRSKIYLTYQRTGQSISQNANAWLCLDPRLQSYCTNAYDSSHNVIEEKSQHKFNLSQFIDVGIYNTSAYTLISETNSDNLMTWFTEKTAKPILARRLFLAFANQGFLRDLREIGFQTFGDIVDESYDDVHDLKTRAKMVVEQMKYLLQQDQMSIFEKIKPIVEHNYNVMQTIDYPGDVGTVARFFKD